MKTPSSVQYCGFVFRACSAYAYVDRNALNYAPQVVRERKESNRVVIKAGESKEFVGGDFMQIHEREHVKRLNKIETARGSSRVKLVGKYSMKMDK